MRPNGRRSLGGKESIGAFERRKGRRLRKRGNVFCGCQSSGPSVSDVLFIFIFCMILLSKTEKNHYDSFTAQYKYLYANHNVINSSVKSAGRHVEH